MIMLVLSRQLNESIMIGENVEVVIVKVQGNQVRLGIKAPPAVSVHRKEVYHAIRKQRPRQKCSA
jgi:carbon storage regulator